MTEFSAIGMRYTSTFLATLQDKLLTVAWVGNRKLHTAQSNATYARWPFVLTKLQRCATDGDGKGMTFLPLARQGKFTDTDDEAQLPVGQDESALTL
jgi:hypothetical protein